jgi:Sec-independent protein translocase protein TatA
MEIAGVGPLEVVAIFIIMLVVAGPKRMVSWAYTLGQYVSKMRTMFQETMDAVKKEIDVESLDIRKDIPALPMGRFDIVSEAARVINADLDNLASSSSATTVAAAAASSAPATEVTSPTSDSPVSSDSKSDDEKPKYDAWIPN